MKRTVLHIIYSLYRGGAERIIESQILESHREDYEYGVCSLTGGGDLVGRIAEAGASVHCLEKGRTGRFGAVRNLIRLIRSERIDLLHLHNAPGMFWGTIAARLGRIGVPIVRTEHGPFIPDNLPSLYRLLYGPFTKRASRVICVCDAVRASFTSRFPELADRHVTVHNGIRSEAFEGLPSKNSCRRTFGLPADVHLIGAVGRLVPIKNHLGLVSAFCRIKKRIPDVHLAIVGDGELKGIILTHAADLHVADSVTILPSTPEIALFYGGLDLFILASLSEGFPLTLLEALAAGVPAVATAVGGIPEIITDEENGFLVPPDNNTELAERSIELLIDREQARATGAAGRESVKRRFTANAMVEGIERVYDEALVGGGRI